VETGRIVDIIIPVHGGMDQTRRCLASLQGAACRTACEIVVIDDASPDEALVDWLASEAKAGKITFLRNDHNQGFAATVNRGMALHPERDVVLLNSDTELAGDWLDRLTAAAGATDDIGTVTPFSNNATICSYPFEGWQGEIPGTQDVAGLDALFARTNVGQTIDLPTGVGFCMLIRRACLDAVGSFDAVRFRHGYGEENDFCRRAANEGWRNVLAADVFVYHKGGASFGVTRGTAMASAEKALMTAHPGYGEVVRDFIRRDPAAAARARVDRARAALGGDEFAAVMDERRQARAAGRPARIGPVVLHVMHDWGGGIERWVREYAAADLFCRNLALHGVMTRNHTAVELRLLDPLEKRVLMAWPLEAPIDATAIEHPEYAAIVRQICAAFDVRALLVSSLIGHSLELLRLDLPVLLVAHDLYPFCPALFAAFGTPCEVCGKEEIARCFEENSDNVFWHVADACSWQALRDAFAALLPATNVRLVTPSKSLRERHAALFPPLAEVPWSQIPHGLGAVFAASVAKMTPDGPLPAPGRLRVLIPGRLSPHKGLWLFRQIREELSAFADVMLLGCGAFGLPFADFPAIEVVENYGNDELPALVRAWRPDCALLLSTIPESFGYTLSEMMALGVPALAMRLGAYAERVVDGGNGFLAEPEAAAVVAKLRDLDQDRAVLREVAATLRATPVRTACAMVADYQALLPEWNDTVATEVLRARAAAALIDSLAAGANSTREIKRLRAQNEEQAAKVLADIRQRAADQRQLELLVQSLAAQYAAVLCSTSWRVSAPVRALGRLRDRLRTMLGWLPAKPARDDPYGVEINTRKGARSRFRFSRENDDFAVAISPRSRTAARDWLRETIGKPNTAFVIAGGGAGATVETLRKFILVARELTRRHAWATFVWCGGRNGELAVDDELVLRLLRETRALIMLGDEPAAEVFAGADVLLLEKVGAETPDVPVETLTMDGHEAENTAIGALAARLPRHRGDNEPVPAKPGTTGKD
jgi:GT2 family glycosyltransferase/glycosyltransferase involved in cell wall biosynthesis